MLVPFGQLAEPEMTLDSNGVAALKTSWLLASRLTLPAPRLPLCCHATCMSAVIVTPCEIIASAFGQRQVRSALVKLADC